jgi:hypothetical protein
MQCQCTESGIVRIGKAVNDGMERVSAYNIVIMFYHRLVKDSNADLNVHTSGFNEASIMLSGQKRIREISEELLEKPSNTIDIMEEIFGITEIHFLSIYNMLAVGL